MDISEFLSSGGLDEINLILAANFTDVTNGPAYRCRVNSRNVWLGAVVGLAGGMVAGPVGMASGSVGGEAMDGANGFIGGVAVELLGSCFRH